MIFLLTVPHYRSFAKIDAPLFVNRAAIFEHGPGSKPAGGLPRARGLFAIDSGGYMALREHGRWPITAEQYAGEVLRCKREIGNLWWAPVMDWMCEDEVLARTGLSVYDHQELTIESYQHLRQLGGDELDPLWVPVLQGRCPDDYLRHFELYLIRGIDLRQVNVVGVGSVCRLWELGALRAVFTALRNLGLRRLHGFGVKQSSLEWSSILKHPTRPDVEELYHKALERGIPYEVLEEALHQDPSYGATTWEDEEAPVCKFLYSADSAAWSSHARALANEIRAARSALGEWVVRSGQLYVNGSLVGEIQPDRAGQRVRAGMDPVQAALLPTQVMPACARRAGAWRSGKGAGRKPHESCNQCAIWALEYRARLKTLIEPEGCWDEEPKLKKLPPPSSAWHTAQFEAAARAQEEWQRFGPERFGHLEDMPRWAKIEALRRRAARGDQDAITELRKLEGD